MRINTAAVSAVAPLTARSNGMASARTECTFVIMVPLIWCIDVCCTQFLTIFQNGKLRIVIRPDVQLSSLSFWKRAASTAAQFASRELGWRGPDGDTGTFMVTSAYDTDVAAIWFNRAPIQA
jgi:hypothetical protein